MSVFYNFFKQINEDCIILLFKNFWIIVFFNISIYAQNVNVESADTLEKNIEASFETPVNVWTINTPEDDFAPYFLSATSEFYYNSIIDGYSKYLVVEPRLVTDTNSYFNISFSHPKQLASPLNNSSKNRAYFSIISDDIASSKYAFVNSSTHYQTGNYVNIHKTIFERNTWSEPTPVTELSGECFIGHPTISPSGDLLVFASNKNSNDGSTDLWIALKNSEQNWDMFAPLDELNSIKNEITPHFVSDSLLLFASDGFEGSGGYDLYYSVYMNGKWTKPVPMENINTEFNETDPAVLMNKYLVLASDRPGGKGKLDLYITIANTQNKTQQITYNFSLSATNHTLDVTKTLTSDLLANKAVPILANDTTTYFNETIFSVFPQHIEFAIVADSNLSKMELNYTVECGNDVLHNEKIKFNTENGSNWIVNFSKWNNTLFNVDSVMLNVHHAQTLLKTLPLEIIKTETKVIKKHNNNTENYYKAITVLADNINDYLNINNDVISSIHELISHAKHVEINIPKSHNTNKIFKELQEHFKTNAKFKLLSTSTENKLITFKITM